MARKGKRKNKNFQPTSTPIDAIIQARQARRGSGQGQLEQRPTASRPPLVPLPHRGGNR